jgi:hypothetical protein
MQWLKLRIAVLAVALVVANTQCMAKCTLEPCQNSTVRTPSKDTSAIPPCHPHQPAKQKSTPEPCKDSVLIVADNRTASVTAVELRTLDMAGAVPSYFIGSLLRADRVFCQESSSPPSFEAKLSTVIRV